MQTSDTTYCWNAAHLYKTAWIFLSHACSMSSPNTPCKLKSCQWRRIIYCLSCLSRTNWSDTYTKINTQRFVSLQIKKSITSGTVPSRYDVTQAGRMRFVFKWLKDNTSNMQPLGGLTLHIRLPADLTWDPSHLHRSPWSCSWTTSHVTSAISDVTRVQSTIRWAEWCNRSCSTGSTGCVPPALPRAALTVIEMAQAVCLYSPESVKQESP